MEPGKERPRVSLDDLDPSWRATPVAPLPEPSTPAPAPAPAAAPTPPPEIRPPVAAAPATEDEPIQPSAPAETAEAAAEEEEFEEEPVAPLPASTKAAVLVSMALGAALVVHFTGPQRALTRGRNLLAQARSDGDPKKAAAALAVLETYVDSTGQAYDSLFEAASLAGDDAAGERYAAKLAKSPPEGGSALLVWYESALIYRTLAVKSETAAFQASSDPAERRALVAKLRAHRDAAAALKPTREKAVESFAAGFPPAEAARLVRIDDMQAKLAAVDPDALLALAAKAPAAADSSLAAPPEGR